MKGLQKRLNRLVGREPVLGGGAGIADHDREPSQLRGNIIDDAVDLVGVGDVQDARRDVQPVGAKLRDCVGENLGASSCDTNLGPERSKCSRHGLTEMCAAPSDECAATR